MIVSIALIIIFRGDNVKPGAIVKARENGIIQKIYFVPECIKQIKPPADSRQGLGQVDD
jgi:hypothetical protein